MLYMPSNEFISRVVSSKNAVNEDASSPGTGIHANNRQIPKRSSVNSILDFSSGILKQLAKVLAMALNITPGAGP
jgi:hypothetical protein